MPLAIAEGCTRQGSSHARENIFPSFSLFLLLLCDNRSLVRPQVIVDPAACPDARSLTRLCAVLCGHSVARPVVQPHACYRPLVQSKERQGLVPMTMSTMYQHDCEQDGLSLSIHDIGRMCSGKELQIFKVSYYTLWGLMWLFALSILA